MSWEQFPLKATQESHVFNERREKSIQQKSGNHLHFSGLDYKGEKPHVITTKEWTTSSALLKVLFVKEVDSLVHLVTWPKVTCDVGEFLKHCYKETIPFSLPTEILIRIFHSILNRSISIIMDCCHNREPN